MQAKKNLSTSDENGAKYKEQSKESPSSHTISQSKIPPGAKERKKISLQPRKAETESLWSTAVPLGINQLSQMLPWMCKEPETHTLYTERSLRATATQQLSNAGLNIMSVHGNKLDGLFKHTDNVTWMSPHKFWVKNVFVSHVWNFIKKWQESQSYFTGHNKWKHTDTDGVADPKMFECYWARVLNQLWKHWCYLKQINHKICEISVTMWRLQNRWFGYQLVCVETSV